jgi:hypothetical protein
MRHLALVVPDDPEAVARDDQFLFGPDLLAAPVLAPGQRTREVYLPGGEWIDLWRSGTWDSVAGAFVLGTPTVLGGRRVVEVPAPLAELPLLVRAGAVLPLLAPDVDTLADYGTPAAGFVSLDDRRDVLHLLAFPRGETRLRLADKTRIRARERAGGWELALRGRGAHEWVVQASLATLERPFAACAVRWRGKPLADEDWSYDAETGALRATLSGKRGRLQVVGDC